MGRLILEHRNGWGLAAAGFVPAALLLAIGAFFGEPAAMIVALAPTALGAFGAGRAGSGCRFHEDGIVRYSRAGEQALRYADLETVTFRETVILAMGIHARTNFRVWLAAPGTTIRLVHDAKPGQEGPIREVWDRCAAAVARRLEQRLLAEGKVRWAGAVLTREGIGFRPQAFVGKGAPVMFPFAAVSYAFADGSFRLTGDGGKVWTAATDSPNFYPGFLLFRSLAGA